ncbi:hypothetical protein HRG_012915 [Hirsutella rhossiliensis]
MQHATLLVCLAGISLATPLAAVDKPSTGPANKLPWKEPTVFGMDFVDCITLIGPEDQCGTEAYCSFYDGRRRPEDNKFKNNEECLAAHQPQQAEAAAKPSKTGPTTYRLLVKLDKRFDLQPLLLRLPLLLLLRLLLLRLLLPREH